MVPVCHTQSMAAGKMRSQHYGQLSIGIQRTRSNNKTKNVFFLRCGAMVDKMPIRQKDLGRNGVVLLYHSFIPLLQYSIIICSILPLLQYHTSVTVSYLCYSIIPRLQHYTSALALTVGSPTLAKAVCIETVHSLKTSPHLSLLLPGLQKALGFLSSWHSNENEKEKE